MLAEPNGYVFVALNGSQVVGYVEGEVVLRAETTYRASQRLLYVRQLCVTESAKRQGHGRRLISTMRACAAERGISRLELDTWAFNRGQLTQCHPVTEPAERPTDEKRERVLRERIAGIRCCLCVDRTSRRVIFP